MATVQQGTQKLTLAWPKGFDPQQQQLLQSLSDQGKLSGVPPQIIAYIQQAESGFGFNAGGAINSSNFGGYFGLANNTKYPAGSTSTALLKSTSPDSYTYQAQIAASSFAADLQTSNGDLIGAENIYQTGKQYNSANGAGIFQQYGITPGEAGGVVPASPTPLGPFGGGVNVGGGVGNLGWTDAIGAAFNALLGGFGIGWKAVLTIIGGILLVGVGILLVFRKPEAKALEAGAMAA